MAAILAINRDEASLGYSMGHVMRTPFKMEEGAAEFFVDLEMLDTRDITDREIMQDWNGKDGKVIFLVGIGHIDDESNWVFKSFRTENLTIASEGKVGIAPLSLVPATRHPY